jgi:chromate transport protein ChrA
MDSYGSERNDATIVAATEPTVEGRLGSPREVLNVFLKLGVSSFGGPIAHIGYFHEEFVVRRRWLDEQAFVDLVALCQFLPGPASSQVGFSIGLMRAGYGGALAAWTGFTLPSAIALVLFAYGAGALSAPIGTGLLHGLKLVAVAIVAQAVWGMARTLCPDRERAAERWRGVAPMPSMPLARMTPRRSRDQAADASLAWRALPQRDGLPRLEVDPGSPTRSD